MKLTKLEIGVIAIILALALFLAIYIPYSIRKTEQKTQQAVEYIQKKGIKNIIKDVWEGDSTK